MTEIEETTRIKELLETSKTIAVVGASNKFTRDSYSIMHFLIRSGYAVYPVNPSLTEIDGIVCYPSVRDVPAKIDVVDIFRNPIYVMPIVEDAIAVGARAVWMQLGVVNTAAKEKAESAGLFTVMDKCILVEHRRLIRR